MFQYLPTKLIVEHGTMETSLLAHSGYTQIVWILIIAGIVFEDRSGL